MSAASMDMQMDNNMRCFFLPTLASAADLASNDVSEREWRELCQIVHNAEEQPPATAFDSFNDHQHASSSLAASVRRCTVDFDTTRLSREQQCAYETRGLTLAAAGQLAVVLLAGGTSSRLSVDYPKGMYSVDLLSQKTLFQLFAERLRNVQQRAVAATDATATATATTVLPLYVMTSAHTHDATVRFFAAHRNFGLQDACVRFFRQRSLPCLSRRQHELLLKNSSSSSRSDADVADSSTSSSGYEACRCAPDGTGGLLAALLASGALREMRDSGVRFVHVCTVDNALARVADPLFAGLCDMHEITCALKVVKRMHRREPIRLLGCCNDGATVRRFVLSDAEQARLADYELAFASDNDDATTIGDVGYYSLQIETLHNMCIEAQRHPTDKYFRVGHIFDNKQVGVKYERALTDFLPWSVAVVRVDRKAEYSPLTYMRGGEHYTAAHCKHDLASLHYGWLVRAGARFHQPGQPQRLIGSMHAARHNDQATHDDLPAVLCEVSPLVSYAGEQLEAHVRDRCFEPPLVLDLDLDDDTADNTSRAVTYNGLDWPHYSAAYPWTIAGHANH